MNVAFWIIPSLITVPLASRWRWSSSQIALSFPDSDILSRKNQIVDRSGILSGNPRKCLNEIRSFACLSSSGSERSYHCCKISILIIRISSRFGRPPLSVLCEYRPPGIGRNSSQSMSYSTSLILSPNLAIRTYSDLIAKLMKLLMN